MSSQCETLKEKLAEFRARLEEFELEREHLTKEIAVKVGNLAITGFSIRRGTGLKSPYPWILEIVAMESYIARIPEMKTVLENHIKNLEKEIAAHGHE